MVLRYCTSAVNVQVLDCDFYAFSGHKFSVRQGSEFFMVARVCSDRMPPYQGGGDMIGKSERDWFDLERSAKQI